MSYIGGNEILNILPGKEECFNPNGGICSPKKAFDLMKKFSGSNENNETKIIEEVKKKTNCSTEKCIYTNSTFRDFAKDSIDFRDILHNYFKQSGPDGENGLLSNFDIDNTIEQFIKKFPKRKCFHIPFQMRDFEKVGTELANIDIAKKFKDNYNTFCVVLNTDYSTGGGIHWFCLFGEKYDDHIELEYFNSSGREPLPEVQIWLNKTKHHLEKELNTETKIFYTTGIKFQDDNHSCGVYCLAYIWLRLCNYNPRDLNRKNFNDNIMVDLRSKFFNKIK